MTSTESLPPLSASDADDMASNVSASKIAPDSPPFVSPPLSTPNAKHSPSSPSSPWKDVPRRLLTVAIGVPSIIFILRHSLTSWLFFQGAHILCLIEWFALMPPVSGPSFYSTNLKFVDEKCNGNERELSDARFDNHGARFLEKLQKRIISPSLSRLLLDNHSCHGGTAAVQLRLSRWLYLQFFTCSIFLSVMPTKFLPFGLMVSVLALRLSLHLPWFHFASRIRIGNAELVSKETTPNSQEKTISPSNNLGFNAERSETQKEQNQQQQQHTSQQLVALQHYQLGFLSVSLGFHYLLQIAIFQGGPMNIGFLLFVVWMADTGALIFGRVYGIFFAMQRQQKQQQQNLRQENQQQRQQPYYENIGFFMSFVKSISPGKTLPGIIGAIVTGPISALLYPIDFDHYNSDSCQFNGGPTSRDTHIINGVCSNERSDLQLTIGLLEQKLLLGILLSLTGILGDLAESSVKRTARAKDSGALLPGHGGVLDRFDSVLVSGVVYYYLILVLKGH